MTIRLAITPGDPAGIGPDVWLKIIQQDQPVQLVAVADPEMLRQRARPLGLPVNIERLSFATPPRSTAAQMLSVIPVACPHPVIAG